MGYAESAGRIRWALVVKSKRGAGVLSAARVVNLSAAGLRQGSEGVPLRRRPELSGFCPDSLSAIAPNS